jgi:hypothetical protein
VYVGAAGLIAAPVTGVRSRTGQAKQVPGIAKINTLGAQIDSLSCASSGNCTAGGQYTDSSGKFQAFVVSQAGGTWAHAEEVPNTNS